MDGEEIETLRPLLPVSYVAAVDAYKSAAATLTVEDLTHHYTAGAQFFKEECVPHLARLLRELSGGRWSLDDFEAFAASGDTDLITNLVAAATTKHRVVIYPGDWFGFMVGMADTSRIEWSRASRNRVACLCIPSVRNGHCTEDMYRFLEDAESCVLNVNLFPTLSPAERHDIADRLMRVLHKSFISISFSRGFGLTVSQLGVVFVHRDHPLIKDVESSLRWSTYFYNGLAARACMNLDTAAIAGVDERRRQWADAWLTQRGLPSVRTGSYYVKAFRLEGRIPPQFGPLVRDGGEDTVVRVCLKPPFQ